MAIRFRKFRFRYNEMGLFMPRRRIVSELEKVLGTRPRIKRFYTGHGWGLKYLVYQPGEPKPFAVLKAASLLIERRIKTKLGSDYRLPAIRFAHESELLARLAEIGLGPEVLHCQDEFFVRTYIEGTALAQLPVERIIKLLPKVIEALETACGKGIYHTDPNTGNVLIEDSGGIKFIDCEIPGLPDEFSVDDQSKRSYCFQRLLYGFSKLQAAREKIAAEITSIFLSENTPPVSPSHAAALVRGELMPGERYE